MTLAIDQLSFVNRATRPVGGEASHCATTSAQNLPPTGGGIAARLLDDDRLLPASSLEELAQLVQLHGDGVLMRGRNPRIQTDPRRGLGSAGGGVAKNPLVRRRFQASVSGGRGRSVSAWPKPIPFGRSS